MLFLSATCRSELHIGRRTRHLAVAVEVARRQADRGRPADESELCPTCGERMKLVAAISSPAQDDIIEKILRHVGMWDPPWQR